MKITIPCTHLSFNINAKYLFVGSLAFLAAFRGAMANSEQPQLHMNNDFPADGTYDDQCNYINNLPVGCTPEQTETIKTVFSAENPHSVGTATTVGITDVITRSYHYDKEFGTLTKRIKGNTIDDNEIMIQGASEDGARRAPILWRFTQDKNGNLRPVAKEMKSITDFTKRLEEKDGLVVEVHAQNADKCFQSKDRRERT